MSKELSVTVFLDAYGRKIEVYTLEQRWSINHNHWVHYTMLFLRYVICIHNHLHNRRNKRKRT